MTNTQNKPSRIPQYYIFRNDESEAFIACLKWWNNKYNRNYDGCWTWYGFDGTPDAWDYYERFQNNPTRFEPADLWALIEPEKGKTEQAEPAMSDADKALMDQFAGYAMQSVFGQTESRGEYQGVAEAAYDMAAAMMAERKNRGL